jgi:hypothetical protein
MTVIRTISVGLALAAYLVVSYAGSFMQWAQSGKLAFYVQSLAGHIINPSAGLMTGDTAYLPAAFILGCLGVGLFSASILWPRIEDLLMSPLRALQNIQTYRAMKAYNAELVSSEQVKG